jgi:hypothetical protein
MTYIADVNGFGTGNIYIQNQSKFTFANHRRAISVDATTNDGSFPTYKQATVIGKIDNRFDDPTYYKD